MAQLNGLERCAEIAYTGCRNGKRRRLCRGASGALKPGGRDGMRPTRTGEETMRKLALRAVIAGAGVLTIMSPFGSPARRGQAPGAPLGPATAASPSHPKAAPPPQADPP